MVTGVKPKSLTIEKDGIKNVVSIDRVFST